MGVECNFWVSLNLAAKFTILGGGQHTVLSARAKVIDRLQRFFPVVYKLACKSIHSFGNPIHSLMTSSNPYSYLTGNF